MTAGMNEHPMALLPELILLLGAVVGLLVGSWSPRRRQWPVRAVAAVSLLAAGAVSVVALVGDPRTVYDGTYAVDAALGAVRITVVVAALLVLGTAAETRAAQRESELVVLVLLGSAGAMVLAGASDLLVLAVGYLLASIPLYALIGWARDGRGAEAALKTYLLGALLGIGMLLGVSVLLGVDGGVSSYAELARGLTTAPAAGAAAGVLLVLGGLLFKVGAVPAHFWVPDAASGATTPAAAFATTVPKVAGLVATYRLLVAVPTDVVAWPVLVAVIAAVTMTLGNLVALAQDDPRRLLGWSTVSQAGYLLLGVSAAASDLARPVLLLYLAGYALANVGAFAVTAVRPSARTLAGWRGLRRSDPWAAGALVVCLLALVGTPPTAVLVGKLGLFGAAVDADQTWLAVVAVANTVLSLAYYLRWLRPAFSSANGDEADRPAGTRLVVATSVVAAVGAVGVGLLAGPLLDLVDGPLLR